MSNVWGNGMAGAGTGTMIGGPVGGAIGGILGILSGISSDKEEQAQELSEAELAAAAAELSPWLSSQAQKTTEQPMANRAANVSKSGDAALQGGAALAQMYKANKMQQSQDKLMGAMQQYYGGNQKQATPSLYGSSWNKPLTMPQNSQIGW